MKTNIKFTCTSLLFLLLQLFIISRPAESVENAILEITIIKGTKYISIYDILTVLKPDHSFNFITRRGKIFNRSRQVIYSIGYPTVIINGKITRSTGPIIQLKGEPLTPLNAGIDIIRGLYPEYNTTIRGNQLIITLTYKPENTRGNNTSVTSRDGAGAKDRIGFIIIDPGHGGKDPGAIGRGGVKEKGITLNISREVESILKRKLKGIKVVLTRKSDRFIELSQRTQTGNRYLGRYGNGIFLSIHVNASLSPRISGYETYFLSQNPSNEDARNTAALENNVIVLEDKSKSSKYGDIDYIEAMMITTQIQKESSMLARSIMSGMSRKVKMFKSRGVRKADFFVLRGALMPAVLVEVGFITNKMELKSLKSSRYRDKVAQGISNGIEEFINRYNRSLKKGF